MQNAVFFLFFRINLFISTNNSVWYICDVILDHQSQRHSISESDRSNSLATHSIESNILLLNVWLFVCSITEWTMFRLPAHADPIVTIFFHLELDWPVQKIFEKQFKIWHVYVVNTCKRPCESVWQSIISGHKWIKSERCTADHRITDMSQMNRLPEQCTKTDWASVR